MGELVSQGIQMGTSPTRNAAGGGEGGKPSRFWDIHKRKNMDCLIVD